MHGRVTFVQVGVPSRIELPEYRAVGRQVKQEVARIERRFPAKGGPTVVYIEDSLDFREVVPLYRLADVCAVTPLHDGMNLVAKEYVAACTDGEGALVLSPFAGAARELERSYIGLALRHRCAGRGLPRGARGSGGGTPRTHGRAEGDRAAAHCA